MLSIACYRERIRLVGYALSSVTFGIASETIDPPKISPWMSHVSRDSTLTHVTIHNIANARCTLMA